MRNSSFQIHSSQLPLADVLDLTKSPDRIERMFDAIAGRYDLLNHLLSAGIDRSWRRRAIRSLALSGRERIVDLCTGTADVAIEACSAMPPAARVIGIDFAGEMLRAAADKVHARGLDRAIVLVRGDARRVPVADGTIEAVTIAFGIRNVEDIGRVCEEVHRVLKPGGRVAILEFAVPRSRGFRTVYMWYLSRVLPRIGRFVSRHREAYSYLPASVGAFASPDELVTILRQHGFVEVRAVSLTLGAVFLYTARRVAP